MKEDKIREAFSKIKEDLNFFHQEIEDVKRTLEELKNTTQKAVNQTTPTHTPTLQHSEKLSNAQIQPISTGNEGVPTLQPTNHPTIQHPPISSEEFALNKRQDPISHLQKVSEIIGSLDELKKEIRVKFKRLTNQEMLIYSTIYQFEDLGLEVTYNILAEKLGLSEISIRDYVRKVMGKGIPLDKVKETNKKVRLTIPDDLKRIAPLSTIIQLREL